MFRTFKRTWWKENAAWPNGLEPEAGRKRYTGDRYDSESEAREACREFNNGPRTAREKRLSLKMEFEEV